MKPTYDQLLGALEAVLPIAECHLNWLQTQDNRGDRNRARAADLKISRALDLAEKASLKDKP